jgi:DNA-binding NarL/FixJ family response regulator
MRTGRRKVKNMEKVKVLIVEGDQGWAKELQQALASQGVDGTVAADLLHARRFLATAAKHVDSVLLDLILPDGRGEELLPELEALPRQPGIVVLSGAPHELRPNAATFRFMWVSESTPAPSLAAILRLSAKGYVRSTLDRFANRFRLTRSETTVLVRIADGASPKGVAIDLGCSLQAVYAHLAKISKKAGCASYHELIAALFQFSCHGLGHSETRLTRAMKPSPTRS